MTDFGSKKTSISRTTDHHMTTHSATLTASDAELIAQYKQTGDAAALEPLLSRHLGKIRNLVMRMVANEAAADDLTQEVFLKAFRSLGKFDGKSQFATWIYRIALNTTYTFIERRTRSPVEFMDQPPQAMSRASGNPERAAMHDELVRDVGGALNELSPKLRAAIVLTSLEQLEPSRAAEIEGCSTSTMYWRIHEARKQLKVRLQEHLSP